MLKLSAIAALLTLSAQASIGADQTAKRPTDLQVITASPADVKVTEMPTAEVRVSNWPAPDQSWEQVAKGTWPLVGATWALGVATFAAVVAALLIASSQSR
jgi:hypothetical protein